MTPPDRRSRYFEELEEVIESLYGSEIEVIGDVGVVAAGGEMDPWTASRFRRDIEEAAARAPGAIVLDLSRVEMIDATALGVMLRAQRELAEHGRALVLIVSRRHRRILAIAGLQTTFRLAAGVAEALEQVAAPVDTRRAA
jgi:anti-anti-sigma factor